MSAIRGGIRRGKSSKSLRQSELDHSDWRPMTAWFSPVTAG
jgi:hypothetical protein